MATFEIPDKDVKMLREALCEGQFQINQWMPQNYLAYCRVFLDLIRECDRHRPLGPNGKHGNLHTKTCGCDDKGHGDWCPKDVSHDGVKPPQFICEHVQESDGDDYH